MNYCVQLLWGWMKEPLKMIGIMVIAFGLIFTGVIYHKHGQAMLDALPSFESTEPLPAKASAPSAEALTTLPFKGVL